jgi:hypothetical protein
MRSVAPRYATLVDGGLFIARLCYSIVYAWLCVYLCKSRASREWGPFDQLSRSKRPCVIITYLREYILS